MLTLENLSLFYEQDKKILDCINLNVADGECILLTGESGSGLFVCEDSEIPVELKDGGGDTRCDRTPESFFENLRFGPPGYEEEDLFCGEDTPDSHGIGLLRNLFF